MIANPTKLLKECAEELSYSPSWLSRILHSDAFQTYYWRRQDAIDHAALVGMADKLAGLAMAAADNLEESLVDGGLTLDPRTNLEIMDKSLRALGFGPRAASITGDNVQINHYSVDPSILRNARELMDQKGETPEEDGTDG